MALDQAVLRTERYFGWKVVGAAFAVAVFGWGIGFCGPSVFLRILHAEHGWSIAVISGAITAHFIVSALGSAYLPELYGFRGVARVTQAGLGLSALGVMLWANAPAAWVLFPAAVVSGAGSAATTGAAINAIVAPWFDRDRAEALSLAFNGAKYARPAPRRRAQFRDAGMRHRAPRGVRQPAGPVVGLPTVRARSRQPGFCATLIIQREFAPADVCRAVALTVAINQAVFAFAPAVLGAVRDLAGDYRAAFALVAAIQVVAAAIVVACRPVTGAAGGGR